MADNTGNDNELLNRPFKRLFRLFSVDKHDIMYMYVYAIFSGLIGLTLPLGIQAVTGIIIAGKLTTSWFVLLTGITLAIAISGVFQVIQVTITESLEQRVFARSTFEFAYRIPKIKLEAILRDKHYPPELVNRFFDTLTVQKGISKILIDFSTSLLQILFALVLLAFYHSLFIFFGVVLCTFLFIFIRMTASKGLSTSLKESKYKYEVAYWLEELARTMSTFKLAGRTNIHLEKTDRLLSNYIRARKKHFGVLLQQYGIMIVFKTAITTGLLVIGSLLVVAREINIGQFVAAEIVIILIINSVEKLVVSFSTIYDVLTAIEKIGAITDMPLDNEDGIDFEQIDSKKGMKLSFQHLNYTFPTSTVPALKDIDLDVASGEKICVSGLSGSGKSTFINLVAGLYETYEGAITYNDIPLGNIDVTSLRSFIGDNLYDEDIFVGTIAENIFMGKKQLTIADVIWAVESLGLMKFVQKMPKGFNTMLEPEGKTIPASVQKMMILARGIVHNPRLLIIENILSDLSKIDKEKIASFLTDKNQDWTLLTVSNDPVIASKCDRVVLLEDGGIKRVGNFTDPVIKSYFEDNF